MTVRTSVKIAIEIAETLSERTSMYPRLSMKEREEILAGGKVAGLVAEYERAKVLRDPGEGTIRPEGSGSGRARSRPRPPR